jgi:nuclear transport factor 2 (NTF2) superfamily protein
MEKARGRIDAYLERLAAGDLTGVLELFCDEAVVNSPLYGRMPARDFYTQLFGDTDQSKITPIDVLFSADTPRRAAVRFEYDWTLGNGTPTWFSCIDVVEFDEDWRIRELTIVYDTHPLRAAWVDNRGAVSS